MYLRIHETKTGKIIAACDKELMGKTFEEGEKVLDLARYGSFYGNKTIEEHVLEEILQSRKFNSVNLVGKRSVGLAIKSGLFKKSEVVHIKGIPCAQIYYI